jgi:SAM-dependent methyltransferase
MDSYEKNRRAWDAQVAAGNRWTLPVSPDVIARARSGEVEVVLTPTKPVPQAWFGDLRGRDVLGLASGGGQQCPIFAAAGARVTSFDASDAQLGQDRLVAEREGLSLQTQQGNMRDLSCFASGSFDLVFNPCSTCFVEDIEPVWREVARVLRPGGTLLTGFVNPWYFLFDVAAFNRGELRVVQRLPVALEVGSYALVSPSSICSRTAGRRGRHFKAWLPHFWPRVPSSRVGAELACSHFVIVRWRRDKGWAAGVSYAWT